MLHRELEVHVELLLRGLQNLVTLRQESLENTMSLLLTLKGLAELLPPVEA